MIDLALLHSDREELMAFALGLLAADDAAEAEQHVAECSVCFEALTSVVDDRLAYLVRGCDLAPSRSAAKPAVCSTRS